MLNPTYRSRCEDFKRIFKDLPVDERLIVDYSCALQRDILLQGRIYVTQNYLCFYANIFRWETLVFKKKLSLSFFLFKKKKIINLFFIDCYQILWRWIFISFFFVFLDVVF